MEILINNDSRTAPSPHHSSHIESRQHSRHRAFYQTSQIGLCGDNLRANSHFTVDQAFTIGADTIRGSIKDARHHSATSSSLVLIDRHLTGYGEERGGVSVRLKNLAMVTLNVTLMDVFPWFMKIYLHTFQLSVDGARVGEEVLRELRFQSSIPRLRPSLLQLSLSLPPNATTSFHLEFEKLLLRFTEYPPDANRGFDVGCALIIQETFLNSSSPSAPFSTPSSSFSSIPATSKRIYTPNLLLILPTPDFSMPYNVITLTSTVIALFFGSLFNIMVRDFIPVPSTALPSKFSRLWNLLKRARASIRSSPTK